MNPRSASLASTTTAPRAVVSIASHDREWWAEEAVRTGTDWSGVVAATLELIVAAGIVQQPLPETITPWDAPSWRGAAVDYHRDRQGHRLLVDIEPKRLARLHRLMSDGVSL